MTLGNDGQFAKSVKKESDLLYIVVKIADQVKVPSINSNSPHGIRMVAIWRTFQIGAQPNAISGSDACGLISLATTHPVPSFPIGDGACTQHVPNVPRGAGKILGPQKQATKGLGGTQCHRGPNRLLLHFGESKVNTNGTRWGAAQRNSV